MPRQKAYLASIGALGGMAIAALEIPLERVEEGKREPAPGLRRLPPERPIA